MKSYIFYFMFSVSICATLQVKSQEIYAWETTTANNLFDVYNMYRYDFINGGTDKIFSIDGQRFIDLNQAFLYPYNFIYSFEFTPDHRFVYFIQLEGGLFRYEVATDSLVFLQDLTPETTPIGRFDYTKILDINFISDSILYVSGENYSEYNIFTNTYKRIWQHADLPNTDRERELTAGSMVKYKNNFIYLTQLTKLMKLDLENPENSSNLINFKKSFPRLRAENLISVQYDCDSTTLYFWGTPDTDDDLSYPLGWYRIDPYTGAIQFSHIDPVFPVREWKVSFKHYDILDCQHVINLDEDASTTDGLDFLIQGLCTDTDIPISDTDVRVHNVYPLDSIQLRIDSPQPAQALSIPGGNYTLWQPNTYQATIRNNGTTTNADFEAAIRSTRYYNTGQRTGGDIIIEVIPYYGGIAGQVTIATLKIQNPLPYAGEDYTIEGCTGDAPLDLISTLSGDASLTGQFWFNTHEVATLLHDIPTSHTLLYITQSGNCHDTAVVQVIVHDKPAVQPQRDVVLCAGQLYTVDLSGTGLDIQWSDGSTDKIRDISSSGIYSYMVGRQEGCTARDTFEVRYLPPPTTQRIDTMMCRSGSIEVNGMTYTEAGVYVNTLTNYLGCDSLTGRIEISYYEAIPIALTGDLGVCIGEKTVLRLPSGFSDIAIDGVSVVGDITIDRPGLYRMTALDVHGCAEEKIIEITAYPSPEVKTQDLNDTVYVTGMKLPVSYSDDAERYRWTPDNGALDCTDCPYPGLIQPEGGIYHIAVTNSYGCTGEAAVSISFKETSITLPTVIANHPAYDDNGRFYIKGNAGMKYDLYVYDRWGSLVFNAVNISANEPSSGWHPNGRYAQGVYVYMIRYEENGRIKIIKGNVTVL